MSNKTIPTAADYMNNAPSNMRPSEMMIEFAKLHVEAALEAVTQVTHKSNIPRIVDNKDSILNAYPLTNIK